jgi:chromosome segregation ATPase
MHGFGEFVTLYISHFSRSENPMSEEQNVFEDAISKLKQERDELKLQMHLAGMEAKDEYERLSGKCDTLSDQYEPIKEAVGETADNVWTALGLVADELKIGFQRVRKAISEE